LGGGNKTEIHFYDSQSSVPEDVDQYHGWVNTIRAINNNVEQIHTTQMGVLTTKLFEFGYRIFIHPYDSDSYEIKLGHNETTNREITMSNNLFNLWKSGEFYLV
jgi:hypothetical protein